MKLLLVVGARPNLVKAAALLHAFRRQPALSTTLVHTGQHYDEAMSGAFLRELDIPSPDFHLRVGSGTHAVQTGRIMMRLERLLLRERPDRVIVVGDVNSTVAAALVAAKLRLPVDHVVAAAFKEDAEHRTAGVSQIPDGWMGLDIGPMTRTAFAEEVRKARIVFWNGPMGVFEMKPFAEGTLAMARALADSEGTTIVGGGDSVAAVTQMGVADKIDHVSTGGGASLEFLSGEPLPGVACLQDAP